MIFIHAMLAMVGIVDIQDEKSPPVVLIDWIITGFDSLYKKIRGFFFLYMEEYFISLSFLLLHTQPVKNPEILTWFECISGAAGLACLACYLVVVLRKKTVVSAY